MTLSQILRVVSVVLFVLAAVSAFTGAVNLNELGFVASGLAAWCLSTLVT